MQGPDGKPPDCRRCPLCGGENRCAVAAGQDTCWCFDQVMPGDLIARLPDPARGKTCVCAACAANARATPPS